MTARTETLIIESAALAGNPLGDPTRRAVPVWLPPSYDDDAAPRFPVIYWLAGFTSTASSLFQGTPWQPGLGDRLERLVLAGRMAPSIVVAPDCFTRLGGSQYLDSPATGLYEKHLCQELIPAVDARFRTVASRVGRGIGGKSSGGYGALVLGMRNPELFCAIASHAGDAYFELSVLRDVPVVVRTLRRHDGIDGFLHHFRTAPAKRSDDIATMMMLTMSAAYAPDATAAHGFALPFNPDTGELVAEVWSRFKSWDPVELVNTHAQALRSMRLIYLDAGTRDEWGLDVAARILASRMRAVGVAVDHQEFDDGHMNTSYRYEVSLPRMAAALSPGFIAGAADARAAGSGTPRP